MSPPVVKISVLTTPPSLKIKVLPKPVVQVRLMPRFPSSVVAMTPILLDRTGGNYTFSLDMNAVIANLPPTGVSSVFGRTGDVVAQSNDYTFAQIGSKPTTLSGYGITDAQPLDSDLTAIAALSTTNYGRNVLVLADAVAARSYFGTVIGADVQAYNANLTAWQAKTVPAGTVVGTTDAQTLSSKTLASPAISGTVSGTGVIPGGALVNTAVTPGSYTNTNLTVDAQGRITAAANGSAGGVTSWNGRTGVVVPASGDYTFSQIGSTPTTLSGYGIADAVPLIGGKGAIGTSAPSSSLSVSANAVTNAMPAPGAGTVLHMIGADAATMGITTDGFAGSGAWYVRRANGTQASPSAMATGGNIFQFVAYGFDGTSYGAAAGAIQFVAEENFTTGGHGTSVRIGATPVGSVTRAEQIRLNGSSVYFPVIQTTASAANAFLDSGSAPANELKRSTSSLVYKRDVEPIGKQYADRVLDLVPIWYRSTASGDRQDWSWYGLGAEDVAAIDPRLVFYGYQECDFDLVDFEEDGETVTRRVLKSDAVKKPDGVMYDRVVVLLLDVVKRLEGRIADLEAK